MFEIKKATDDETLIQTFTLCWPTLNGNMHSKHDDAVLLVDVLLT